MPVARVASHDRGGMPPSFRSDQVGSVGRASRNSSMAGTMASPMIAVTAGRRRSRTEVQRQIKRPASGSRLPRVRTESSRIETEGPASGGCDCGHEVSASWTRAPAPATSGPASPPEALRGHDDVSQHRLAKEAIWPCRANGPPEPLSRPRLTEGCCPALGKGAGRCPARPLFKAYPFSLSVRTER